jgi:uncharacterized protein (DUF885 family)
MSKRTLIAGLLLGACLIGPAALAAKVGDSIDAVVKNYEALAAQTDGLSGPGWPNVRPEAVHARLQGFRQLRHRLSALRSAPAQSPELETRELLAWRLDLLIEAGRFDEERIPFDNGDGFFNTANYAAAQTVLRSDADARAWNARLKALPDYYRAQIANMRRGLATGFTQPRSIAEGILRTLEVAADQPVEASPLLGPFRRVPATLPDDVNQGLRAEATAIIRDQIKPIQLELVRFFENEYIPGARVTTGARQLPDGEAYYPFLVRRSTTLPLSPEEVESIGEAELARLAREMEVTMREAGWQGDLRSFIEFLRTEPDFYAQNLESYIEKGSEIGKRVDALLPLSFGKLPRLTWGLRRKPPELDASSSGYDPGDPAKGIAGSVVVGSRSYGDPLFSLPAWILHEGVPGHHLQIALAQERSDLPPFRRKDDITAFVEGWALYSEYLGLEMGVYRNPYERFGRLAFEVWRACRLVMDVAIHWRGQAPEQAEQCLLQNTTLPRSVADYETARYTAWPAQALAYKIGELHILALRRHAETKLGRKFDLRRFHDQLLDDGPMPLIMADRHIERWIERSSSAASPDSSRGSHDHP